MPTEAHQPPKPLTLKPTAEEAKEKKAPSTALMRLLQTAFNRESSNQASQARANPWPYAAPRDPEGDNIHPHVPYQNLYQALDKLNKHRGSEDSLYSDYSDAFYNSKPYRHRDDRLLQALLDMVAEGGH